MVYLNRSSIFSSFLALILFNMMLQTTFAKTLNQDGDLIGMEKRRVKAGFYTTRFGKRGQNAWDAVGKQLGLLQTGLEDQAWTLGKRIEGYDERGHIVSCIATGSKNLFLCDRDEENW